MDFFGPLLECEGYDIVLNANDHFIRRVICIPCKQDIDSGKLAHLLNDHVYAEHGLPCRIITDCGSMFVSKFTHALLDQLGIKGSPSMVYHPQTDSPTERYNQELKTYVVATIRGLPSDGLIAGRQDHTVLLQQHGPLPAQ